MGAWTSPVPIGLPPLPNLVCLELSLHTNELPVDGTQLPLACLVFKLPPCGGDDGSPGQERFHSSAAAAPPSPVSLPAADDAAVPLPAADADAVPSIDAPVPPGNDAAVPAATDDAVPPAADAAAAVPK